MDGEKTNDNIVGFIIMKTGVTTVKKTIIVTAIFLTLFYILEAKAEQSIIRLNCQYSEVKQANGSAYTTSDVDLVTVSYSGNNAIITTQGYDDTKERIALGVAKFYSSTFKYEGTISDEEIEGVRYEQVLTTLRRKVTLRINRYTGALQMIDQYSSNPPGKVTISFATCKLAPERVREKKF